LLVPPFAALPALDKEALEAVEAVALQANDRYLLEIVEEHAFCPWARGGRTQGQTTRFVHYGSDLDVQPIIDFMARTASDPTLVVAQVIMPMVQVSPEAWIDFCNDLTTLGNRQLGAPSDVYAVAALHPELRFQTSNPFTLIPLFRRSPDPTIQWVRLDGLEELYRGRTSQTTVVDPSEIDEFIQQKHRPPLFEQIAETNMEVARQLGIDEIERALAEISRSAQERYAKILDR
jgi:hypothetical protein